MAKDQLKSSATSEASSTDTINLTAISSDQPDRAENGSAPGSQSRAGAGEAKAEKEIRRAATNRRTAGRRHIAANDDMPSIGGLIYALQQRPSRGTFVYALLASIVWFVLASGIGVTLLRSDVVAGQGSLFTHPLVLTMIATIVVPIALFWFLAVLVWRAQELRLMASAMTEVAVRLAEPDKMAEQSVASIGQTVRRQVAAMNDALSRALGRAGELEALVHNEVTALERSYSENEIRIRGLIDELASEREALANNSERVSESLRGVGAQVAKDIAGAGDMATKSLVAATSSIADTLAAKGEKITAAVSAAGQSIDRRLAERGAQVTEQLLSQGAHVTDKLQRAGQQVNSGLQQSTQQITAAMHETTRQVTATVESRRKALFELLDSVSDRIHTDLPQLMQKMETEQTRLNTIIDSASQSFEALENSLAQRTDALDNTLLQRTQAMQTILTDRSSAIEEAFANHAQLLDSNLKQRTQSIHTLLSDQSNALEDAFTNHAQLLDSNLKQRTQSIHTLLSDQSNALDENLTNHTQMMSATLVERIRAFDSSLSERTQLIEQTLSENTGTVERSMVRHTMALSQLFAEGTENVKSTTEQLTAQSSEAADNLSTQADVLKDVSGRLLDQIHGLTQRFENQGHAIMSAAQALDSSNAKIDSILERRHTEINGLLQTVSTKARDLDSMMQSYSGLIENALTKSEARAKEVTAALAKDSAVQSRAALAEIEQLRAEARAHTNDAVAELKSSFESITGQVADQIKVLTQHFSHATQEMRESAQQTAGEMESTRREIQRRMRDLPNETRQSTEAMRKVLADQMRALSSLSAIAAEHGTHRDILRPKDTPPPSQPSQPPLRTPPVPTTPPPATPAPYQGQGGRGDSMDTVTADLARQLGATMQEGSHAALHGNGGRQMPQGNGNGRREPWSLGDLLARASEPERDPFMSSPVEQPPQQQPPELRFNDIAGAIDDGTANELWQRFRRGERNILSRQLYTVHGQATFDEIAQRYTRDPDFRTTVDRYMGDFERLLREAQPKDHDGQLVQNYLCSETGRVYLMLAHASGRLS